MERAEKVGLKNNERLKKKVKKKVRYLDIIASLTREVKDLKSTLAKRALLTLKPSRQDQSKAMDQIVQEWKTKYRNLKEKVGIKEVSLGKMEKEVKRLQGLQISS